MTKKSAIIEAALQLFSEMGYTGTSTRTIATKTGVSEGLIFRHFKNKEGLLLVLLEDAEKEIASLYEPVLALEHPKVFLKQVFSVPFQINEKKKILWRFLYTHQWFEPQIHELILQPLYTRVFDSFQTIGVSDPKSESESFLIFYKGLISNMLLNENFNAFPVAEYILKKFSL
ncbi:MAG: TetR/AcrR family transcriptional regulator [Flavobacteriaceae bacterium]